MRRRGHWILLIVVAGLVGSLLYGHGAPGYLVYIVRHLIYEFGRG
jgi:hypothetical protein